MTFVLRALRHLHCRATLAGAVHMRAGLYRGFLLRRGPCQRASGDKLAALERLAGDDHVVRRVNRVVGHRGRFRRQGEQVLARHERWEIARRGWRRLLFGRLLLRVRLLLHGRERLSGFLIRRLLLLGRLLFLLSLLGLCFLLLGGLLLFGLGLGLLLLHLHAVLLFGGLLRLPMFLLGLLLLGLGLLGLPGLLLLGLLRLSGHLQLHLGLLHLQLADHIIVVVGMLLADNASERLSLELHAHFKQHLCALELRVAVGVRHVEDEVDAVLRFGHVPLLGDLHQILGQRIAKIHRIELEYSVLRVFVEAGDARTHPRGLGLAGERLADHEAFDVAFVITIDHIFDRGHAGFVER